MIIHQALECHVPQVKVVLEPVMLVPRITDVRHGLPVCGGVVRVPLQEKVVLAGRLGRVDTVRPLTGI